MELSTAFFEFIFSESPRDFKAAYESLNSKPYQIFDLLLSEERFTNFFSRIEVYGGNLAALLGQFPILQKDDHSALLLQEMIRALTLSLLSEGLDDMKSRSAVARIVVSVVKLSGPSTLGQFGVRLGALPGILRILIAEGHIQKLALTHKRCFEDLISEPCAREQWAEFAMHLCRGCEVHRSGPTRTSSLELTKFIRSIPCKSCAPSISLDHGLTQNSEGESTRFPDHPFGSNMESKVFKSLLGEPLGPWKIILSQEAMENLGEENSRGNFEGVRRKLTEIASGDWGGKKILHRAKWDGSLSYRIPLFQAFYKTGSFILWQIDTAFDERFDSDYQVIKVWAIGNPKNLGGIGVQIHRTQQVYTKVRVAACNKGNFDGSPQIRYPAEVCLGRQERSVTEIDDTCNEDCDDSAQLAKFYSLTTAVLDNIASAVGNVAYPVDISGEEASVVDHFRTPAFILGRSGTGKTTCLVYKLAGRYINSTENRTPLKQVLLTRSKRLASKLRVNAEGLIAAKLGAREGPTTVNDAKNDGFDEDTKRQFLSLTDEDFPLVCTFDYLLRLLENSIKGQENRQRYLKIDNSKCDRVIDFTKFNIGYWKRLSPGLKKGIPADLAFLEIMGVIKGSVSPATDFKPLSREEYLGQRWRLAPNFASERERDAVYDIYEWYERAKKKSGDIDQADRIIEVTKALEPIRSSEIFRMLNEVYVDEVQDQRTSDIGILLSLVRSPLGIHFAGDTAQCISKDALFRFANAKSLFYERFIRDRTWNRGEIKPMLLPLSHNFRSHKQILSVASLVMDLLYSGFPDLVDELPPEIGDVPGPKPALYIGGNLVDILKTEEKMENPQEPVGQSGQFNEYGEMRVILVRDEDTRDKLRSELGKSSLVLTILQSKGMEFEDVFLYDFLSTSPYRYRLGVLEELFKRRHHTDLAPKDNPGHEGGSGGGKRSEIEGGARLGSGYNMSAYQGGHAGWAKENMVLCSELKNLYVGVTRARHRLWILESNTCILGPVQRLFNQIAPLLLPHRYPGSILEILTEQDIEVSELRKRLSTGTTISSSLWREMGYQMIDDQQYSEALHCFCEAEDRQGIMLANAYIIEEMGLTKKASALPEAANDLFIKASELFLQARSTAKAVQCRKEGGDSKGVIKILANNGAYEDAAWLAAEVGLFPEASEIYTKLNKHEKALAGYVRGKKLKWMFNYLRKFESEIEICCRKQYARFGYLKEFGEIDTTPDELEKRVLNLIGSLEEQEAFLSGFNLMNKLFNLLSTNGKYIEAYEVGVSFALLEGSVRLLSDKILSKNPNWGQGELLNLVCKFLQAEHIAANPWSKTRKHGIHKVLRAAVGRGSSQIDSYVKMWEGINQALDRFFQRKANAEIENLGDMQISGYVGLLVVRSAHSDNKFRLPLDHIERVLEDLRIISSHGAIPPSVQLYCGIYEMPRQPGKYIILDWSPFWTNSELRLPPRPVDITPLRGKILRHILGDIVPPVVSLDEGLRAAWRKMTGPRSVLPLTTESLARLCRIISEYSTIINHNRQPKDPLPQNWDWKFWRVALLEKMEFRSSHEQSIEALFSTKSELLTREGKYHALYSALIENDVAEIRIKSAARGGVGASVTSLLGQYQTSLFLGYKDQWVKAFLAMRTRMIDRWSVNLKYGWQMVNLANRFVSETGAGDFPGRFCENISVTLGVLGRAKDALNFYSAPIISLYEELALSLIFLVRPYELLIPDSWHRLYFNRWEGKYRSSSALERFRYQQCLAEVCLSFCRLVINIERRRTNETGLGRRSVTLIVVCLINLGTFFPRPLEYEELWRKSQEVFRCSRLNARGIVGLQAVQLIGRLAKVFQEYRGNDSIRLVRSHQGCADSFAGIPLEGSGISVVRSHPVVERERHLWKTSRDPGTRKLNAVHILTAFWKLNGPRYVEKMRERRERNAARILTAFWKRNGPRVLDRIKERRRYFAPRNKYSKNCCLLVDMRGVKNWTH